MNLVVRANVSILINAVRKAVYGRIDKRLDELTRKESDAKAAVKGAGTQ